MIANPLLKTIRAPVPIHIHEFPVCWCFTNAGSLLLNHNDIKYYTNQSSEKSSNQKKAASFEAASLQNHHSSACLSLSLSSVGE